MNEQEQAKFDGWAIVDVLGHQRYVGFVRTEAYGAAVLFRVDVPQLPEREFTLKQPEYASDGNGGSRWCPAGTKVKREATSGYTKLIGAGSIYTITPCDEEAAMKAIEATQRPELKLVSLPPGMKALPAVEEVEEEDEPEDDEGEDEEEEPGEEEASEVPL